VTATQYILSKAKSTAINVTHHSYFATEMDAMLIHLASISVAK